MLVHACTENMEWIHARACSKYNRAVVKVYTHMCTTIFFKQKQQQYSIQWSMNMMTNDKYAHDYLHANNLWKQFMEHQSIGCRRRCPDVGTYMH